MKIYIYCLVDPETLEPRYVGKTNNLAVRYKNHLNKARDKNTHKRNWLMKLKDLGLKPDLEILEETSVDEWKEREKYWIRMYRKAGFKLTNCTDGGDGLTVGNQTTFKKGHNSKKVFVYNKSGNLEFVFDSTIEASNYFNMHKSAVPAAIKNKHLCDNFVVSYEELSKIEILNRFNKPKRKLNSGNFTKGQIGIRSKKVYCYSLDGLFVEEFNSAKSAAQKFGVTGGAIQFACLKSKKYICKGYKFYYEKQ